MAAMTSLAILNPTRVDLPNKQLRQSSTAQYLEHKTRRIVEFIDRKEFDNPEIAELLTSDYCAYLPHCKDPYINSLADWLDSYRQHAAENPEYFVEIASISATVNEKNGTANVWLLLKITGHPSALQRENVTLTHWKRQQGRWRAYKQTGMRGFGGLNP